ncbi:MAG TPA: methylated-DNA--[protein]-cysteine S-methyltransferase [Steroidobacteraceae bacterium]|jgi:O-6-methylguanine DNA methyltransferase|nr:methylated-DNA--[protein]-cysteine S-methyltransferase [Steroidobacteraceae bacterium]
MTPLERSSLQIAWIESPVGLLRAGASDTALQLLEFVAADSNPLPANPGQLRAQPGEIPTHPGANTPLLDQTRRELAEYFAGTRRRFEVPLSFPGTPFQERVWSALCSIGYGERISYLEQSRRVGDEKAIRAVAQANGQNPIAILVPCHRVINSDGKLGGYGGGLLRKQFLLDLERGDRLL